MKLIKLTKNEDDKYNLLINHINIVNFDSGSLYLPKCTALEKLTILFTCKGTFKINGNGKKLKLGSMSDYQVEICPGTPGYETQPTFIHCDDSWFVFANGCIAYPEN